MALNIDGYLGVTEGALDETAVSYHDWQGGDGSSGKAQELGHTKLHKIVRTTAVNQDGETVVVHSAIDTKCLGNGHAGHGVKAELWRRGGWG